MRLHLSALNQQDGAFGESVVHFGVVLLFQTGAEEGGEGVVEACLEAAHVFLDEFVARHVALAVDEFDEEFALCEGEFLESGVVLRLQFLLLLLHVGIFLFLGGQRVHVGDGLVDCGLNLACEGIDFLDVVGYLVVFSGLCGTLEGEFLEHVEVAVLETGYHLALVVHHAGVVELVGEDGFSCHGTVGLGIGLHLLCLTAEWKHGTNHC